MQVKTFQSTIENGQVRFAAGVCLPEKTTVYVVVPDFEQIRTSKIMSRFGKALKLLPENLYS